MNILRGWAYRSIPSCNDGKVCITGKFGVIWRCGEFSPNIAKLKIAMQIKVFR